MKHSICFIDDKIPISTYGDYFDDTDIINGSIIKFLLHQNELEWDDSVVKSLCEKLVNEPGNWTISAFTSPAFYSNYTESTVFSPEIVIFDWDYEFGPGSDSSETYLLKILQESYTMIFVFSGSDNIDEIKQIIQGEMFQPFGDRLGVIDKHDVNSVNEIFTQIAQKEQENFSFSYGFEVVRNSNKAINQVLSDISLLSIEDFIASIGELKDGNKYIATNENFIDAIVPRYKSILRATGVATEIIINKTNNIDLFNVRKTWSFRLYDNNNTNKVRMGDILRKSDGNCFLVASSDCHLHKFKKTNFAFLSLIPMYLCGTTEAQRIMKRNKTGVSISSLTSNKKSSITILPCVPINNIYVDYMVIPKGIMSIEVETGNNETDLLYENLVGYEKITSVSDPFKSPLMQYIFDNITGYGCPDFPDILKTNLNEKIKHMQS